MFQNLSMRGKRLSNLRILLLIVLVAALGCQTVKLMPDSNPASVESNYLSVESSCKGKWLLVTMVVLSQVVVWIL